MGELSQAAFHAAVERGKRDFAVVPRARAVRHDRTRERLVIDLVGGDRDAVAAG